MWVMALSLTLAFSEVFVAGNESFLAGDCQPQKQIQEGATKEAVFKFVRLENMFAQFISIHHSVPNLVQLVHKCVEIFFL